MVLKKLVDLKDLSTEVVVCPTLREADGLAMSSRNLRLSPSDREKAVAIFKTLTQVKASVKPGSLKELKRKAAEDLNAAGFKTDYIEIADADTLELVDDWNGRTKLVSLCAAFLNDVRLIDNMLI
jgi:pantoate--beta-alanine ligase